MNIEQYRALKAQEEEQAQQEEVEQPVVEIPPQEDVEKEETKIEDTPVEPIEETKPITVEIDGEEVSLDELKNGYLRQSDYTKKTQEVSKQRKEAKEALEVYNQLKQNPQLVEQIDNNIKIPANLDPTQAKVIELETTMYEMMLEREIEQLQAKYDDFEVMEVLNVADEKGITNLEDAYHIVKSTKVSNQPKEDSNIKEDSSVDIDKLREELKQELLEELKNENVSTRTIISSNNNNTPVEPKKLNISNGELKVASMMGMSGEEYVKWRDAGTKKK